MGAVAGNPESRLRGTTNICLFGCGKDTEPCTLDPPQLDESEFRRRFFSQFQDQAFSALSQELDRIAAAAGKPTAATVRVRTLARLGRNFMIRTKAC
jgi:hypothetical protein